ncbi:EAL domain-containing protein [Accumulibacter sp.]|uniref:putative bifunctional diguanylate cyclase/phosphodiesterase n=1 Tax=Accumulibacter sp. TaxID=2053492 RepID=UPI0028C453D6|nr:EAL domain-containing protein [Accumulibacter sp.]
MHVPETSSRPTALIVDDDHVMRMLERETLTQFEFEVREASSGEEAIELLSEPAPDLVLLDVDMPGVDGFEVCRRIRHRWSMTEVPVIMVTGMDDLESINRAYQSGANDFIAKPINWPVLGHRARYVLRSAQEARQLLELEEKQAAIMHAIPDTIFLMNRQGIYLDYKAGFGSTLHLQPEQFLGRDVSAMLPADVAEAVLRGITRAAEDGEVKSVVYQLPTPGGIKHYEARLAPSGMDKVVMVVRDISLQKLTEEKVRRLAYFDTLTGLPNRESFLEKLGLELRRASRANRRAALLFLDLDGFKRVNDALGHTTGDNLLQAIAEQLKEKLRPGDIVARPGVYQPRMHVARLGGDEFTVVLPDLEDTQTVQVVAQRLQTLLAQPFRIGEHEVTVTASIGIAVFPEDGDDAATLLKHADTAMYHAKDLGRNNWQFYDKSLTAETMVRLTLEKDIRKGLERAEFHLLYQPQVRADDGMIVGLEALIRWRHPERGTVSPAQFIPVAEDSGLIVEIGDWVLRTACRQLRKWQQSGVSTPRLAVNVSARQLRAQDFLGTVAAIIANTGVDASQIELELTESILMAPDARRIEEFRRLRDLGVNFSIDDFGTGYSSLAYIKRFPIGMLKIDQSFVRGLPHNADDAGITTAIVAMAHSLGLEVIAEGVETRAQFDFLQQANCHKMQGYLFSRPLPADEIERLLRKGRIALPACTTR